MARLLRRSKGSVAAVPRVVLRSGGVVDTPSTDSGGRVHMLST